MGTKELKNKLKKLNTCLSDESKEGYLTALNTLLFVFKERIKNGYGAAGEDLGVYISYWKKIREGKGKQTQYKDLFFNGDLFRSIQTGTSEGRQAIGFLLDKYRIIMRGQESQLAASKGLIGESIAIGKISKEEIDILKDEINKQINITIDKCLN